MGPLNQETSQDLCRCMYSHGSLHSEVVGILRFIEDCFEKVEGSQNYRYRKHGFISQLLESITDPAPSQSPSMLSTYGLLMYNLEWTMLTYSILRWT